MGYFRELPNLEYESPFANRISSSSYIQAKNIFRRMKIRDDLQNVFTLFNKYEIREGARPDTIAEELYGKSDLDWVVLLSANIINLRDRWPLSSKDLYEYTVSKYGLENIYKVHHYETKEVKDSDGNLIHPAGKIVDKNFSISYSNNTISVDRTYGQIENLNIKSDKDEFIDDTYINIGATTNGTGTGALFTVVVEDGKISTVTITDKGKFYDLNETIQFTGIPMKNPNNSSSATISVKERLSNTVAISNYEYEIKENEKKQTIYLLKPSYLQQFLNDMRSEMAYSDSSQFVNKSLIRTQNTRVS